MQAAERQRGRSFFPAINRCDLRPIPDITSSVRFESPGRQGEHQRHRRHDEPAAGSLAPSVGNDTQVWSSRAVHQLAAGWSSSRNQYAVRASNGYCMDARPTSSVQTPRRVINARRQVAAGRSLIVGPRKDDVARIPRPARRKVLIPCVRDRRKPGGMCGLVDHSIGWYHNSRSAKGEGRRA